MANRFWVGGAGIWDASDTTHWSASSGGAAGASAPTTADSVFFDANSGSGTVSVVSGAVCGGIALSLDAANIIVQLNVNFTISNSAMVVLSAGTFDINNYILTVDRFESISTNVRTLAFGTGKIVCTRTTNIGYAVDLYSASNATILTGIPVFEFTGNFSGLIGFRPPLNSTNYCSVYVKAGTGTFAFGSGFSYKTIDFTGFSGITTGSLNIFGDFTYSSTMPTDTSTAINTFKATSGTQKITTNGVLIDRSLTFNGVGGTFAFQDALTQGSTRTTTLANGTLQLKAGVTSTVGSFATSGTNQKYLQSTLAGSQATLSDASGTNSLSYTTIQDINATGGATWNAVNGALNKGNNSGWYFSHQMGNFIPSLPW